jgi:hypothetical protein
MGIGYFNDNNKLNTDKNNRLIEELKNQRYLDSIENAKNAELIRNYQNQRLTDSLAIVNSTLKEEEKQAALEANRIDALRRQQVALEANRRRQQAAREQLNRSNAANSATNNTDNTSNNTNSTATNEDSGNTTDTTVPDKPTLPEETVINEPKVVSNKPISVAKVQNVPIYPGCGNMKTEARRKSCLISKISKFVARKFNSELAQDIGLKSGKKRINVNFMIDRYGEITVLKVRAQHKKLEKEAIRVIESIPKMIPGKENGKSTPVIYNLPISYVVE